jgi:hypothetical protein
MQNSDFGIYVREFHSKFGFPLDGKLAEQNTSKSGDGGAMGLQVSSMLIKFGEYLVNVAQSWKDKGQMLQEAGDGRLYRGHMMTEEFGEMMIAMGKGDEVKFAHELADLGYTVYGTAEQFSIPLMRCLLALHASNMSKEKVNGRMRSRDQRPDGPYFPPDIRTAIEKGREDRQPKIILTSTAPEPWAFTHLREKDTLR